MRSRQGLRTLLLATGIFCGTAALPTRGGVALALQQMARCEPSLHISVGLVGTAGEVGRNSPGAAYARALVRSKFVVTCNPTLYEGDSRLFEALASGALVLADRMLAPPPGVVGGESVVWYDSRADLFKKLAYYLSRPDEADAIAARGQRVVYGPDVLVERAFRQIGVLPALAVPDAADAPPGDGPRSATNVSAHGAARRDEPVAVFVVEPAEKSHRIGEYLFVLDGLAASRLVRRVQSALDADVVLIDVHRVDAGNHRGYQHRNGARHALTRLWPSISSRRARGLRCAVVAFDWRDGWLLETHERRIDFYFKRSRVNRANQSVATYARPVLPLWYPLKRAFVRKLQAARAATPLSSTGGAPNRAAQPLATMDVRRARPVDVSCFLLPDAGDRAAQHTRQIVGGRTPGAHPADCNATRLTTQ